MNRTLGVNITLDKLTEIAFQIILYSGNGKANSMKAIHEAKIGNYEMAEQLMMEAGRELTEAHKCQTKLLQGEANGINGDVSIILVHSQDHLMTSMTFRDLAQEFIDVYQHLAAKSSAD